MRGRRRRRQGASVVRRLMDGGPDAVGAYVAEVRAAIDAG